MLSRDMAKLEDRLAALGGLEGADAPTLAAEHPRLLREDAAMLSGAGGRAVKRRCSHLQP